MTPAMPRPRPRFLHRETTRHGKTVWYVRRASGARIRLPEPFGTEAFWQAYQDAIAGRALGAAEKGKPATGSVS